MRLKYSTYTWEDPVQFDIRDRDLDELVILYGIKTADGYRADYVLEGHPELLNIRQLQGRTYPTLKAIKEAIENLRRT